MSNKQQNSEIIKDHRFCDASPSSVMILKFTLLTTNDAQKIGWQKTKAEEKIKLRIKIEQRIRAVRLYFIQYTLTHMNCKILFAWPEIIQFIFL